MALHVHNAAVSEITHGVALVRGSGIGDEPQLILYMYIVTCRVEMYRNALQFLYIVCTTVLVHCNALLFLYIVCTTVLVHCNALLFLYIVCTTVLVHCMLSRSRHACRSTLDCMYNVLYITTTTFQMCLHI